MNRCALVTSVAVACVCLVAAPEMFAQGNESNEKPWFDLATSILELPYITLVSGSSTPSFVNVRVRLTAPEVLGGVAVPEPPTTSVQLGAMVYSKFWESVAGGSGTQPAHAEYTRCKACHGWDLLATAGGYVRRGNGGGTRSGAVNIRLDRTDYTSGQILNGSWTPGVDTATQSHPNFNGILTSAQVDALVAYLNCRDCKFESIGVVYNAPNPVQYDVPFGDAARGQAFYSGTCQTCHGAPEEDSSMFPAGGPSGGLLMFFKQDGKPSELAHKTMWGEVGTFMTRPAMGNPTSQDVADVVKYLQSLP